MYLGEEFLHKFTATQVVPGDVNQKDITNKKNSLDKQAFSYSFIPIYVIDYDLIKTCLSDKYRYQRLISANCV